jgi:hypothetical protein
MACTRMCAGSTAGLQRRRVLNSCVVHTPR